MAFPVVFYQAVYGASLSFVHEDQSVADAVARSNNGALYQYQQSSDGHTRKELLASYVSDVDANAIWNA